MTKRILIPALGALLISASLTSTALAGRYHVYSCRTPAGEAAPVDGWSGTVAPGGAYDDFALNTCAQGGGLIAALGDQTTHMAGIDRTSWEFSVPTGRTLTAATLWRAGDTAGGSLKGTYQFWLAAPVKSQPIDECASGLGCDGRGVIGTPFAPENRVPVPQGNLGSHIYSIASCGGEAEFECPSGKGDANNYAAVVYLYGADLTLEQTGGPTASGVGGELTSAPSVAGASSLTFNASDPGAGIYEAVFTVDGSVVQRTVIDENGGRCRNVGQTSDGLAAFLYLQPCPASVSADMTFDASKVANGPHHLRVDVLDAAGNQAVVLDRNVTVANPGVPGPPNGQGASSGARLEARWKSTAKALAQGVYGKAQTIVGRLVSDSGAPISGALLDVSYTRAYAGAKTVAMASPRTASDGRFSMRLPAGASSESVLLAYRVRLGDATAAAKRTLQLSVAAPISLTVTPRVSGVGRTIRFHGRLVGGPIPKGGKAVVLEARAGSSRWIQFKVVRSDSRGRFRASYRFRFPGPVRYQFRVVCEHEADYPYATGASHSVAVHER
jgi:hypothetical protein